MFILQGFFTRGVKILSRLSYTLPECLTKHRASGIEQYLPVAILRLVHPLGQVETPDHGGSASIDLGKQGVYPLEPRKRYRIHATAGLDELCGVYRLLWKKPPSTDALETRLSEVRHKRQRHNS
jgi:hypothetical protein